MLRRKINQIIKNSITALQKKNKLPCFEMPSFSVESPFLVGHSYFEKKVYGDYTTNIAFFLSKILKKDSLEVAEILAQEIRNQARGFFERVQPAGKGFINFWINQKELEKIFKKIFQKEINAFRPKTKKEKIIIEYSSPNIAKPLGVHHLSSTIIGQALVNILRFWGYKVISLSFLGDWGTQFGALIYAYKKWGLRKELKKNPVNYMLKLYVKFFEEVKKDPSLKEQAKKEFKKLEEKKKENLRIWRLFLKESLKDFERVYKLLGVKIENIERESLYEKKAKNLIKEALKKGIAQKGEKGAIIIRIPTQKTPILVQKADGATIYIIRDLASLKDRIKRWNPKKILYVVSNQQTLHFNQLFELAKIFKIISDQKLFHIKFGMMLAPGGKKFATREGKIIPLEDLLKEAIKRAKKIVEDLNPSLSSKEKEKIAKIVGIGAIKFFCLSRNRLKDIVFGWDEILNLKGFCAPYIQYTYVRILGILKKAKYKKEKKLSFLIENNLEREIIFYLSLFDEVVEDISVDFFCHRLAEYLYNFSNFLNYFYEKVPVIKAEKRVCQFRLNLLFLSSLVIKTGLGLLGISCPSKM